MNELNYVTLPMAKRLKEAGIEMESEAEWGWDGRGFSLAPKGVLIPGYPAYSMAELWRALPEEKSIHGMLCGLTLCKYQNMSVASYSWFYDAIIHFKNPNPADALAELLIWVKGKEDQR